MIPYFQEGSLGSKGIRFNPFLLGNLVKLSFKTLKIVKRILEVIDNLEELDFFIIF